MIKDVKLIEVRELYELIEEEMAEMILAAETAEEEEILNQARERIHTLIRSAPVYSPKNPRPRYAVHELVAKNGNRAVIQVIDADTCECKLIGIEVMDNLTVRGTNENRAEREGEANED